MVLEARYDEATELALSQRMKDREANAYEELIERYQQEIFRIALAYLKDPDEADCATQECFVRVFQKIDSFREKSSLRTWLTRIIINVCLDRLKSRKWAALFGRGRKRAGARDDAEEKLKNVHSLLPTPEEAAMHQELSERIRRVLATLSSRQKTIFVLKHYERRSLREISQITDLTIGTVKSHLSRALHKVRDELKGYYR
ncbi:MAG: RNA polymerase sigma factor [Acidobacteria bacterium]|nr:RNA polymerase sigma factor [Acidobacteriota bacterium]